MKRKLRIGLMIDSERVDAWIYHMLSLIKDSGDASFELVVVNTSPDPTGAFFQKPQSKILYIAYNLFRRLDEKMINSSPDAFQKFDVSPLVEDVPRLEVQPVQTIYSDRFKNEDIQKIKACNLDILIRLGFRILRGDILTAAKFGIWSYHHADNRVNRGGPPGFWEVAEQRTETGALLQILTEELDGGKTLYRSYSTTDDFSIRRNKNNLFWKSAYFLPRVLHLLHESGTPQFNTWVQEENRHPVFYSERLYRAPMNWKAIRIFSYVLWRKLRYKLWRLFFLDQWVIMFSKERGHPSPALFRYRKIYPPRDRFWADPYVITKNGTHYVFIEELLYKTGVGHISLLTIDSKGKHTPPKTILQRPYHLSYPFVFEHKGDYYMVPETSANKTIELYRCRKFPDEWEFVMNLIEDIEAADSTLLYRNRVWWMFTAMRSHPGISLSDELFLFYAKDLFAKKWKPHPKNPVVSDIKFARPAGSLFEYNGNLYRPSQNCTAHYGYSISINHVLTLNEEEYSETPVTGIKPNWEDRLLGVHTINFTSDITVIDALIGRRKLFPS